MTTPAIDLPYLTDSPGIGGVIKQRPEDFFVQEMPLYEPTGEGEHVYCEVQKMGMTTFNAVSRMAQALKVPEENIGYAGMKDARAVTRQLFSISGVTPDAVMALNSEGMSVMWAARHGNKLRLGHLAANRFAVKIRNVDPTTVVRLKPIMALLQQRGMPNYFGEQRFGMRGNNDLLGAALVRGDYSGLLKLLLGSPNPALDEPDMVQARTLFDERRNEEAMHHYPRRAGLERRILARLIKTGKPSASVRAIDQKLRRLWVSALQSRLFNEVVSRRIASLDQLQLGDLAYKHENGACFLVHDLVAEQPRCEAFEISPTGPLAGYRMSLPEGEPLLVEQEVFSNANLTPADFRHEGREKVKGARRPLRVQPTDIDLVGGVDDHGTHVTVAFTLPPGSFATVLLRELMKNSELETL